MSKNQRSFQNQTPVARKDVTDPVKWLCACESGETEPSVMSEMESGRTVRVGVLRGVEDSQDSVDGALQD